LPHYRHHHAGDHGVAEEGVSAYPKAVTPQMVRNMLAGGAAVNVLARHVGAEVRVVDIGVDDPLDNASGLIRKKIRPGTGNIAQGPAMTPEEALHAMLTGAELAREAFKEGITLLGAGDMGIANTTPSSALFAALLPCEVEAITGRGTGIDDATLERKIQVIKKALVVNRNSLSDPFNALATVGGFEIAGITGLILGAAACRIPVVVDGFISSAGALVACRMCGHVKEYLFFSHCSAEKGHVMFFERFRTKPILDLTMRLGEGTGAALAMTIIEAAIKTYNEMATFDSAQVSKKAQ
jgi:nicotinate-nucleotide--dimethylbenzimidazole phosphoribosyltransferase